MSPAGCGRAARRSRSTEVPLPAPRRHAPWSIRVLSLHQRERSLRQYVQIEQHRPVLDIVEIAGDALLDFVLAIDLAAPAVDLRPAGDAGFHPMTGEVTVHRLIEQSVFE